MAGATRPHRQSHSAPFDFSHRLSLSMYIHKSLVVQWEKASLSLSLSSALVTLGERSKRGCHAINSPSRIFSHMGLPPPNICAPSLSLSTTAATTTTTTSATSSSKSKQTGLDYWTLRINRIVWGAEWHPPPTLVFQSSESGYATPTAFHSGCQCERWLTGGRGGGLGGQQSPFLYLIIPSHSQSDHGHHDSPGNRAARIADINGRENGKRASQADSLRKKGKKTELKRNDTWLGDFDWLNTLVSSRGENQRSCLLFYFILF